MESKKDRIKAYILLNKSNDEIVKLCNVSLRTVQRYRKEIATNDTTGDTKNDKRQTTKLKKEMAKVLIEEGNTISETMELTGMSRGTVGRLSSDNNLQQSQLEYLKSFRDEYRQKVRKNKLKRLSINNLALEKLASEVENSEEGISKANFEKIKLSEEIEQLIFECDRIERLEKTVKEEGGENKILEFLEVLQGALKDE